MNRRIDDRLAELERRAAPLAAAVDPFRAAGIEIKDLSFEQLCALQDFLLNWPDRDEPIPPAALKAVVAMSDQQGQA